MKISHGKTGTRLHRIWKSMRTRCRNPNSKSYKDYGGRGINICEEWNNFQRFYDWAMSNGYQDDLTIDRKDNDGNYEPNNCRWITYKDQANNNRRNVKFLYKDNFYTAKELSKITGISINTLYDAKRIRGVENFTDYIPKKGVERYICNRGNSYEVTIKKIYRGKYKTLEEAREVKNRILQELNMQ